MEGVFWQEGLGKDEIKAQRNWEALVQACGGKLVLNCLPRYHDIETTLTTSTL